MADDLRSSDIRDLLEGELNDVAATDIDDYFDLGEIPESDSETEPELQHTSDNSAFFHMYIVWFY